ncbi:unnamed protein product [Spirodela intermedia]|uniref:Uncharacterized protein n=1 Tax=Spirodela intermedia TaxID=51605 RepID=A0A7I8JLV2_SPIIN|nr:unnamed protein product [Spirodela intermedia]CAA6671138.1 unnamed protein product [Spirodela intermedia]
MPPSRIFKLLQLVLLILHVNLFPFSYSLPTTIQLQQFRQKKDHKSSNNRTSSQVKSSEGAGKHEEDENAEIIPHVSLAGLESVESSSEVNTIEADTVIGAQVVLPVTELPVTLPEGDSGMTIGQEHTPDGSSSSTMAYGTSGNVEELKDSGDPTDPSSEDRARGNAGSWHFRSGTMQREF